MSIIAAMMFKSSLPDLSLVARWPLFSDFNDNIGSLNLAASGAGRTLVSDGTYGTVLSCDGTASGVVFRDLVASGGTFPVTGFPFSYSCRRYFVSGNPFALYFGNNALDSFFYHYVSSSTFGTNFSNAQQAYSAVAPTIGGWDVMAAVFPSSDLSTARLYKNNVLVANDGSGIATFPNVQSVGIGGLSFGGTNIAGPVARYSNVQISNIAWTAAQVATIT